MTAGTIPAGERQARCAVNLRKGPSGHLQDESQKTLERSGKDNCHKGGRPAGLAGALAKKKKKVGGEMQGAVSTIRKRNRHIQRIENLK